MSAIAFNGEIFPSGARTASDQIYDNSNTGLPASVQGAIDKTTGNISSLDTVELTATAAHAHAAGSTFLWIGQLVKVTTAIAVGDTIALGTNVTNTDICSVLSELNSKTIVVNNVTISVNQYGGGSLPARPSLDYIAVRASIGAQLYPIIYGDSGISVYNASMQLQTNQSWSNCSVVWIHK